VRLEQLEGVGSLLEKVPKDKVPVNVEISKIAKSLEAAGADLSQVDLDEAVTFFTPAKTPKGQDPIIPMMKNGKVEWYQVPAELYNTLSGLDLYRLPKALDLVLGAPTQIVPHGHNRPPCIILAVYKPGPRYPDRSDAVQVEEPGEAHAELCACDGRGDEPKAARSERTPKLWTRSIVLE
jgi:hypothetical protein